jgi:peroxiredoxin
MRSKIWLLLLLLASSAHAEDPGESRAEEAGRVLIGQPAPAATLRMLDGQPLDLATLYGKKPVYLKFWATWCVPCREQMPGFEKDFEEMGDKIATIAVDVGFSETEGRIRTYRQDHGLKMPIALDDGSLGTAFNLRVTPEHIVIGRDGRILHVGHLADEKLHQALARAIAESEDRRLRAVLFFSPGCESYLGLSQPDTAANCKRFREQVTAMLDREDISWQGIAMGLWTLPEDVTRWETKVQFPLPFLLDTDGRLFHRFGVQRIPAVALIDPDGKVLRMIGAEEADLAAAIKASEAGMSRRAAGR